jgi:hypothetical protein
MARQIINNGTIAGDGTGEVLFSAFDKTNDNFVELYKVAGWVNYAQSVATTQTITSTASKLIIDGGGASSNSSYLPLEIRGVSELWDTINNKITPIAIGDGYTMRLDLTISTKTGNPNGLDVILDIGGTAAPSNIFIERVISTLKSTPYKVSVAFPFYTLSDFKTNGGQIFLKTDTGTLTITVRELSIHRISSGTI